MKGLATIFREMISPTEDTLNARDSKNTAIIASHNQDQISSVTILTFDVSGSMSGMDYKPTRLKGAIKAAQHFLIRLSEVEPENRVGIVKFGSMAKVVSHPLPIGISIGELQAKIDNLSTGCLTNIGYGLTLAGREISRIPYQQNSRILLLTDGSSNAGPNPVRVSQELKARGIQLDIIGIGGSPKDVNEPDLKKMASVVNGELRYWFIKTVPELVKKFESLALREIK